MGSFGIIEAFGEDLAGVGVGQVYRAGANALDLAQDGFDLFVFPL